MAEYRSETEGKLYRIYITDSLKILMENSAAKNGGKYIAKRYIDLIDPPKEETKTCAEITSEVASRCGITMIHSKEKEGDAP